ncbi:MAG TPA: hypothetical protein VK836_21225 [Streptosporangiaceae bacterium]|nr:hypothetical protein [Streptosporangiaceae bacterium]
MARGRLEQNGHLDRVNLPILRWASPALDNRRHDVRVLPPGDLAVAVRGFTEPGQVGA